MAICYINVEAFHGICSSLRSSSRWQPRTTIPKIIVFLLLVTLDANADNTKEDTQVLIPVGFPETTISKYKYLVDPYYSYVSASFGYVGTNVENHVGLFSLGFKTVTNKSIGYFGELQFNLPWEVWDSEAVLEWSDEPGPDELFISDNVKTRFAGGSVDGGITLGIGTQFHVFLGTGLEIRFEYRELYPGSWVGNSSPKLGLNATGGVGIRQGSAVLNIGVNKEPRGISASVGYAVD
jgi:hypothetical protein